jgi:hypothetical protein
MNTRILEPAQSRAVAEPAKAAARKFPCLAKTRRAGGFALFVRITGPVTIEFNARQS